MDEQKINKIKNKVYNEGIDTLTQEELEYLENKFIIELTGKYFEPSLGKIISEYYTKNNNLDKIIYFSNYAFENKHERDCNYIFEDYMYEHETEEDIKKYEELDYPFVHKYLGEKYYNEKNIDKALEHFKKGAEQKSFFCADHIFKYYTSGNLGYLSERLENIDFEKAVYYADLLANSVELTDDFYIDGRDFNYYLFEPLEKTNSLTEMEKNKIMSKIMNSKGLLYYKSLIYIEEGNLDMFLYYCELSASKGYYKANKILANMYIGNKLYTIRPEQDLKKALYYTRRTYEINSQESNSLRNELMEKIIDEGKIELLDAKDLNFVGDMYYYGREVKQDYKKAIEYYEASAEKGDSSALNNLGYRYLKGLGVEQDYKKAIKHLEASAEKGNSIALNNLGYMYQKGLGVKQDYQKAIEYYETAAEKGNSSALNNLGYMYQEGLGVKQDYQKAIEYYETVAEKGISSALHNLGYMYQEGLGVKQDYTKAIKYFEAAAEKENESSKRYIMRHKYINNEQISYNELFELEKNNYQNDKYFENIKEKIEKGSKVIVVENIKDLTLEQLNGMPNDTIINIKYYKDIKTSFCNDFYTCSDMKKIIKVCNKILEDIDLSQSEEDIFMQIYIKLAKMISYDNDAIKKHKDEKYSTSRNLMVLLSKKGVCAGYAEVLKCLLNMAGIECNVLSSKADKKSTCHAYNQVKINGKWYYCDLTWDNDLIKLGTIHYCLKSKKKFERCLNSIYHTTSNTSQEYEANEDYQNINLLFIKNNLKLLKKKLNTPLEQMIEPAGIKEYGGITR